MHIGFLLSHRPTGRGQYRSAVASPDNGEFAAIVGRISVASPRSRTCAAGSVADLRARNGARVTSGSRAGCRRDHRVRHRANRGTNPVASAAFESHKHAISYWCVPIALLIACSSSCGRNGLCRVVTGPASAAMVSKFGVGERAPPRNIEPDMAMMGRLGWR